LPSGFRLELLAERSGKKVRALGIEFDENGTFEKMRRSYAPALAVGIGAVAGLRALTAPAILAWASERRLIRLGSSPFATLISGKASRRITHFALAELVADKLPFTPSRLNATPLASRIILGSICGATIYGSEKRPLLEGAVLGSLGAIAGAFAGYHVRKRLSRDMPDLGVAILEDAFAIGGGVFIIALTGS
jgi:uncharacterized membrane protein